MPSTVQMMKLHATRGEQMKALAGAKGISVTEALELLINRAIEAGDIPDVLPGFEVRREGGHVGLTLDGTPLPAINPEMARHVADDLEHAGTALKHGKGVPRWFGCNGYGGTDFMLVIGRIGTGVVVSFEEMQEGKAIGAGRKVQAAMTRGMAVDLARQIRNAATTA
jgi:hypothetical protein